MHAFSGRPSSGLKPSDLGQLIRRPWAAAAEVAAARPPWLCKGPNQ